MWCYCKQNNNIDYNCRGRILRGIYGGGISWKLTVNNDQFQMVGKVKNCNTFFYYSETAFIDILLMQFSFPEKIQ